MIDLKFFHREVQRRWAMYSPRAMNEAEAFFAKHFSTVLVELVQAELDEEKVLLRGQLTEMVADVARVKERLEGQLLVLREKAAALAGEVGSHQDEPGSLRARVKMLEEGG